MDFLQATWLLVVMVIFHIYIITADQICNQCDCTIRDSTGKGNINVKPKCQSGKITWPDPVSAVRLELKPEVVGPFKACIALKSENIVTLVSREITTETVNYRTRSYDSKVDLLPWFSVEGQGKEHCVTSSESSVMLYLEIESTTEDSGLSRTFIYYDIELIPDNKFSPDPMEECQPCSDDEILRSYCISDYVVVGRMKEVNFQSELDKTKVNIIVDQIVKTTDEDIFKRHDNLLEGALFTSVHCGVQKGPGQFLFTGRNRLGQPILTCAPFYDQWIQIQRLAQEKGTIECAYG
ncbi:hypothetical protein LOTGIDRAFT_154590 [Lottia gigantea]|uniref:NTR domain-containing protein n=1 Tax=Lottia gigantea TaxID=225164 RepID=V3ZWU6_LOTGI|nr:hypothetical protein LOTGIDRAFT_154590 [Lottia gigantea]ESO87100.1 hypothetical protein LOTGIDRAFT_154590 [Lottia gigantea]